MAYTAANSSLNDWRKNSEVHRLAKTWAAPLVTLSLAAVVTQLPPPAPLNQSSMYFLATLMAAIAFWIMEVFDQHVVAFLLLLSWLFSGIVPSKVALAGFSENAWFFVIGAFAMGVSVNESGLLRRMGAALLSHIPPRRYKLLTFILFGSGFVATPLLPLGRARAVLLGTFNKSIFHTTGFKPCSNGSAGLGLSTFLASGQMSFMFLTGAAYGLAGWSLLPQSAKAEFGWLSWLIAALPAGIFSFLFLFAATHFVFPLTEEDRTHIANRFNGKQTETARPWSSIGVFSFSLRSLVVWVISRCI